MVVYDCVVLERGGRIGKRVRRAEGSEGREGNK